MRVLKKQIGSWVSAVPLLFPFSASNIHEHGSFAKGVL